METRSKGKVIIGISMAAIMVVSVLAAAMPMAVATSNGTNFNTISGPGTQKVLIGQNLQFDGYGDDVTISRIVSGDVENVYQTDANNRIYNVNWPTTGAFFVNYDSVTKMGAAQLSVEAADIPLTLKVGTKAVASIAEGTELKVYTGGINLYDADLVDLAIIGPDGQIKTDTINNQVFTGITVAALKDFGDKLITTGWKIGDYTFQVKSKEANACGLDVVSDVKPLKILKGEISIDAEPTSAMELDTVTVTVTGVADDKIRVAADPCDGATFKDGVDDTPANAGCAFTDTIDSDGVRKYAIEFSDTGTYTLRATVEGGLRDTSYDTVDITVLEKAVEFDMPNTAIIGERITVKGTSTSGTYVSVWIDDTLFPTMRNLVLEDGEFSKEVTTTDVGMSVPGSVRLKAWIDATQAAGADAPTRTADGETAILMQVPLLTAELSTPSVAVKDDFKIDGYAPGSTNVWIMAVPPKGGGGKALTEERKGITIDKASVATTDNSFTKKLTVQKDATSGYYDLYVLSPGMDEVWDMTSNTDLVAAINTKYHIADITDPNDAGTKTQAEVQSMLESLVTSAGSDDLMEQLRLKVESAYVRLDPIADVNAGTPLVVKGASNRQQGFNIVVTCKGPVELEPAVVKIEDDAFTATFDTTDALTGEYVVKADDGDGHTDEVEVFITGAGVAKIVEEVEEVVEIATPAPTLAPTPKPTPAPTPEPTPEPPGFEAIFAIAGLLAVAYLVHRRKN
jgi:PGF-CTERM protein